MDDVQLCNSSPREEVDEEGADVSRVRIAATTVKAPGPYWHDEFGIVHLVRVANPNYTMCHRFTVVTVMESGQITGYTDATPNCLLCVVIIR